MVRSNEEKRALQRLLTDLLNQSGVGNELAERARAKCPGTASVAKSRTNSSNVLTRAQRDFLKTVVANEYWPKLTVDQKQKYLREEPAPEPVAAPSAELASEPAEIPSASSGVAELRGHTFSKF